MLREFASEGFLGKVTLMHGIRKWVNLSYAYAAKIRGGFNRVFRCY